MDPARKADRILDLPKSPAFFDKPTEVIRRFWRLAMREVLRNSGVKLEECNFQISQDGTEVNFFTALKKEVCDKIKSAIEGSFWQEDLSA